MTSLVTSFIMVAKHSRCGTDVIAFEKLLETLSGRGSDTLSPYAGIWHDERSPFGVSSIKFCPELRCLALDCCHHVGDLEMFEIAQHTPQLTTLDLSYCQRLTEVGLRKLGASFKHLQSLRLDGCYSCVTDRSVLLSFADLAISMLFFAAVTVPPEKPSGLGLRNRTSSWLRSMSNTALARNGNVTSVRL
jgi:hypothetical protein